LFIYSKSLQMLIGIKNDISVYETNRKNEIIVGWSKLFVMNYWNGKYDWILMHFVDILFQSHKICYLCIFFICLWINFVFVWLTNVISFWSLVQWFNEFDEIYYMKTSLNERRYLYLIFVMIKSYVYLINCLYVFSLLKNHWIRCFVQTF
jgi:hypothetical protein